MAYVTVKEVPSKAGKLRKVYLAKWTQAGKTREKSFSKSKDAKQYAAEMHELHEGTQETPAPVSAEAAMNLRYNDVAAEYLLVLESGKDGADPLAAQTLRTYKGYLNGHVLNHPSFKTAFTRDITKTSMEALRDTLTADDESTHSTRSMREVLRLAKAVMQYAVDKGYADSVPGATVTVKPTRSEKATERLNRTEGVYTPDQVKAILRAADSLAVDEHKGRRAAWQLYRGLTYFLVHTGARISEARGFPRKAYSKERGLISITQRADEEGAIGGTKSADSIRDIPLNPGLIEPLERALAYHKRALVFSTSKGEPLEYRNLYNRMWKVLIARANELAIKEGDSGVAVPALGFHALRHAYASRLIAAGANLKHLQTWMGHHDPAFTLRTYGHLFSDDANAQAVMAKMAI